ncbi:MAG: hypothetical protein IKB25_05300 [Lentisphaeria bacterium]|nr:hypothetical protein [Lentisphaeria bacterium]
MSQQDLQLSFEFPAEDTRKTVPAEHIAAPEDGSLLEGIPEPEEEFSLFAPEDFELPPPQPPVKEISAPPPHLIDLPQPEIEIPEEPEIPQLSRHDLQRASLAWLASLNPTAAAMRVPTRLAKFRAGAAAFWSSPGRHRLLQPDLTVVVEARLSRNDCWPECSDTDVILPSYRECQANRRSLEESIRKNEPFLLDSDVLFPEIEYWNYEDTENPDYKPCLEKLAEFESALYRGSRFERIRQGEVANELYLAVPEGLIDPDELAEGWGLLYVFPDMHVELIRKAAHYECPQEHMLHLSQNIAASSLRDVLFAHGIYQEVDGKISYRRPPKLRAREKR